MASALLFGIFFITDSTAPEIVNEVLVTKLGYLFELPRTCD